MRYLKIKLEDIPAIFEEPELSSKVKSVLEGKKEQFDNRYREILKYLAPENENAYLSDLHIKELFKANLYEQLVKEAIQIAINTKEHDISKIIMSILTEEKVDIAIRELPMIEAFEQGFKEMLNAKGLGNSLFASEIGLREKFLN